MYIRASSLVLVVSLFVFAGGALRSDNRNAAPLPDPSPGVPEAMTAAAQAFLNTLGAAARAKAQYAFGSEERFNWYYVPRDRNGLMLKEMTPPQREAAHALLDAALSEEGYHKATSIMALETILKVLENGSPRRDPEKYYFTIFGTPAADSLWGWRVEGHHLSLNFSSITGALDVTPAFLGTNPAEVPSGPKAGWRILADEEDLGRTLLAMLTDAQRAKAVINTEAPADVITGNDRQARLEVPEGLPAAEMTPAQRDTLMRLVEEYVFNLEGDLAEVQMERIRRAGIDRLHFAWAGSAERGEGHYYRVQGPTLLLEYDNTQNDANHAHAVWRDLEGDFGEDLLRQHYEESPHHQHH
jgi:hypothetical protein